MKHPSDSILLAYYENSLSPSLDKKLKAHLEKCDHCQNVLKHFMGQDKLLSQTEKVSSLEDTSKELLFNHVFQMMDQRIDLHQKHSEKLEKRKEMRKEVRRKTSLKLDELILNPALGAAFSILIILLLTYSQNQEVEYQQEKIFELETTIIEGGDF